LYATARFGALFKNMILIFGSFLSQS
jgi:hypothetical protein